MTRSVVWSATAAEHLESIALYVATVSPVYALRLVDRILAHIDHVAAFPESGRAVPEARDPNVREVFEGPYRIMYLAQATRVDILAIIHGRRHVAWPPGQP